MDNAYEEMTDHAGNKLGYKVNEDNNRYLSADDIALIDPDDITKMVNNGVLIAKPYIVSQITMPAVIGPDGIPVPGATYFQDPITENWHENGLPFDELVGGATGAPTLVAGFNLGYVGAKFMPGELQPEPDVTWDLESINTTGNAVHAPMAAGISDEAAQEMLMTGELGMPSWLNRTPTGGIETYDTNSPAFQGMYDLAHLEWAQAQRLKVEQQQAAEKIELEEAQASAAALQRAGLDYNMELNTLGYNPDGSPLNAGTGQAIPPDMLANLRQQFGLQDATDAARVVAFEPPDVGKLDLPDVAALGGADPIVGLDKIKPAEVVTADLPGPEPTPRGDTKPVDPTFKPPEPAAGPKTSPYSRGQIL
jgi:hypothetical protein